MQSTNLNRKHCFPDTEQKTKPHCHPVKLSHKAHGYGHPSFTVELESLTAIILIHYVQMVAKCFTIL